MNVLRPVRSRGMRVRPKGKEGTLPSGSVDAHCSELLKEILVAIRFC